MTAASFRMSPFGTSATCNYVCSFDAIGGTADMAQHAASVKVILRVIVASSAQPCALALIHRNALA